MNILLSGTLISIALIYLADTVILKFFPDAKAAVIILSISLCSVVIIGITKVLDWLKDKIKYSSKKNENKYKRIEDKPVCVKGEDKSKALAYETPSDDPDLNLWYGEMGPRNCKTEKRIAKNGEIYEVIVRTDY